MLIGDKFQHKHIPGLTCRIVFYTKKGAKVKQTQNGKTITQFYDEVDFEDSERGLWTRIQEPTIMTAKQYFVSVFGQQVHQGEKLELIPGDYSQRVYKRFTRIDDKRWPQATVTMHNSDIANYLKIIVIFFCLLSSSFAQTQSDTLKVNFWLNKTDQEFHFIMDAYGDTLSIDSSNQVLTLLPGLIVNGEYMTIFFEPVLDSVEYWEFRVNSRKREELPPGTLGKFPFYYQTKGSIR